LLKLICLIAHYDPAAYYETVIAFKVIARKEA